MSAVHDRDTGNKKVLSQVRIGPNKRNHIRQMEKMRKSKIVNTDKVPQWQPINIPCMGETCHCFGSDSCKGKKICDALF